MGKDLAVGIIALAVLVIRPAVRAPYARRSSTELFAALMVYVVGIGQAALVLVDPAFEHDGIPASQALYPTYQAVVAPAATGLHNHLSQTINALVFLLALICLYTRIHDGGGKVRTWVAAVMGLTIVIVASATYNHAWNPRLLLLPCAVFVVTRPGISMNYIVLHLRRAVRFIVIVSFVLFFIDRSNMLMSFQPRSLSGVNQLAGLTPHPNALGAVAGLAIALELDNLILGLPRRLSSRAIALFPLAAAVLCCIFAQSHGGWIAAAVVVTVMLVRARRPYLGPLFWTYLVSFAALAAILMPNPAGFINRELDGRSSIWHQAIVVWHESPIIGTGPNGLAHQIQLGLLSSVASQAHNMYLESLAYAGFIGFAALVVFTVTGWLRSVELMRNYGRLPVAAFLVLFMDMLVESPLLTTTDLPLAVLALLAGSVTRPGKKPDPTAGKRSATADKAGSCRNGAGAVHPFQILKEGVSFR